jgi:putative transposase
VVQRGNNRLPCFFHGEDYSAYREALQQASRDAGVAIHAYVLMTNHVHLLVTGGAAGAVSRMMQALGRRYVRYINTMYRRTGTLWEGRFKSCLVESELYLLTCYRYIEFNPLRARMVAEPDAYRWSSHRHNALAQPDGLITEHEVYRALGTSATDRAIAYRAICAESISEDELIVIRAHLEQERAFGSRRFQDEIEANLARCAHLRGPGRPCKTP